MCFLLATKNEKEIVMGKVKDALFDSDYRIDGSGAAVVDASYYWQPLETCPCGVKVQLLGKSGVAMYGQLTPKIKEEAFFSHWAPLPKIPKEHK